MQTAGIFDIPHLRPLGRINEEAARRAGVLPLFWACGGLEVRFDGTELRIVLEADFAQLEPWIAVEVDGAPLIRMPVNRGCSEVCVFRGAEPGRPRTVRLLKETQPLAEDPRSRLWVRGLRGRAAGSCPCRSRSTGWNLWVTASPAARAFWAHGGRSPGCPPFSAPAGPGPAGQHD